MNEIKLSSGNVLLISKLEQLILFNCFLKIKANYNWDKIEKEKYAKYMSILKESDYDIKDSLVLDSFYKKILSLPIIPDDKFSWNKEYLFFDDLKLFSSSPDIEELKLFINFLGKRIRNSFPLVSKEAVGKLIVNNRLKLVLENFYETYEKVKSVKKNLFSLIDYYDSKPDLWKKWVVDLNHPSYNHFIGNKDTAGNFQTYFDGFVLAIFYIVGDIWGNENYYQFQCSIYWLNFKEIKNSLKEEYPLFLFSYSYENSYNPSNSKDLIEFPISQNTTITKEGDKIPLYGLLEHKRMKTNLERTNSDKNKEDILNNRLHNYFLKINRRIIELKTDVITKKIKLI